MKTSALTVTDTAHVLKLMGDPTRLSTLRYLFVDECCVCELVHLLNISQPAISQHLRKLKDAKIVNERRKGHWIFYSINKDHQAYELIEDILNKLPSAQFELKELSNKNLRIICD